MEFLAVAVDKLWNYTVVPVARQVGYVIFYHSNVNDLKMEVAELQRARERVQHEIDAAERNGERIEGEVLDWLKQVDEMKMKADDLNNDERHANTACSGRSIPNLLLRHKLSRGSKKTKEEIVKIKTKGNFNSVSYKVVPMLRAPSLITHGEQFGSRVSVFNDIMESLQDPNVQKIGLYGLGGVGKTTLVKEVANKSQQQNLFDVVVLAYVTQNPKTEEIQYQIADMLGLKLDEKSNDGRANRLYDRLLKKEQRILLILDDLWAELKFDEIGIPSIKQHKGLKILMTSRNREVLSNNMKTQKDFVLQALTKDEAWKLFVDKAQIDVSSIHGELLLIASKIAEKCDGLPVAIVTIASSLKEKGLPAWNDALQRLQNPSPTYTTSTEAYIYNFIEVSYQNLENDLLRSIFLLCGEMTSISSIDDLFKISFGLGLFKNLSNMKEARNKFDTCIDKLKDVCLLQDSNLRDRFIMHDVVQAAAIFLASRDEYLFMKIYEELQEWPENDRLQNCRTIILQQSKMDELPEELDYPNLSFLHLDIGNSKLEVPDNFFKVMSDLKVLTLVGRRLKSLPPSFNFLSNLRTLCLYSDSVSFLSNSRTLTLDPSDSDSFVSEDIAIIGELKGLKVLTLGLRIPQLPQELGQLTQLQLLDLRYCFQLEMIPPNVLSSFRKLVELYFPGNIQWYIDYPNNPQCSASLAELDDLTRLTTLEIFIPDQRMVPKDLVLERLQRYHITVGIDFPVRFHNISRRLELNLSTSIQLWENVKRLLDNVETLVLEDLKGAKNVVPEINVQGMPQLKKLFVSSSDEIQTIIESSGLNHTNAIDIFPNLKELQINQMTNLIRLWDGPLVGKSFSRLKYMWVYNCPKMKSLFSASIVTEEIVSDNHKVLNFPQLRFLTLTSLPELISFCNNDETYYSAHSTQFSSDMGDNSYFTHTALFDDKVTFPSLEEMTIRNAYKLDTVWHWQRQLRPNSFDKLRELEIESCSKLIILFPSHVGNKLHNLETLFIKDCESLEQVFDLQGLTAGLLEILCFPNLQDMRVEGCKRLRYLFPACVAKNLCKLQKLKVKECHMMEDIILKDDNTNPSSSDKAIFPNLEELIITGMDKLNRICCWNRQLLYPNYIGRLGEVGIRNSPEVISIFPCYKISTTQSLQKLTIIDCKSLEQIFDLHGETSALPVAVKQRQAKEVSGFPNLEDMQVERCERLKYLFPAFVARSLGKIRKLTIRKCLNMEEIIMVEDNTHHSFNKEVLFPNLEEMTITNMDKLNRICCWPQQLTPNSFGRLGEVDIRNCPELISIFPCYKISTSQSLQKLFIIDCKSLEQIFELRGVNVGEIDGETNGLPVVVKQHQAGEELTLPSLNKMCIEGCERLKYFFPLYVAKRLSNIKRLEIRRCSMMEEIIMVEDNIHHPLNKEIVFPNLEEMIIYDMDKLNTIWDMQQRLAPNSFGRLEYIKIRNCPGLMSLFPCYVKSMIQRLEYFTISDCKSLEEIFDMTGVNEREANDGTCSLPVAVKQQQATNVSWLPNLMSIDVRGCDGLKYLLPETVAKELSKLKRLYTRKCPVMEVLITNNNTNHSSTDEVLFPNLEKITITNMDKLNRIWSWQQKLAPNSFGSLEKIEIRNCPELVFTFPCDIIRTTQSFEQLIVIDCKSLEQIFDPRGVNAGETDGDTNGLPVEVKPQQFLKINVKECECLKYLFPLSVAKSFRNIRKLKIEKCSMMEEIIMVEDNIHPSFCKEVVFPNLELMIISDMDKLNTICHSFHLLPPTSFGKLRTVETSNCPEFIFPSQLQSLEMLRITNCKYLEQISGDTLVANSILLSNPKLMELYVPGCHGLPFLSSSSLAKSLDNLRVLTIKECSKMEEIIRFEDDIDPLFGKTAVFPNLKEMIITDMAKMNTIWGWKQQLPPNSFGRLRKIKIRNCEGFSKGLPLSLLKSLNNLQVLELQSCNSLREVFDLEKETDVHEDQTHCVPKSSLEALLLCSLPNFKQLWNKDPRGIVDFQNLSSIHVLECESVKYLFPVSIAKSPMRLRELKIESCAGLEHIVAGEEGTDTSISFVFPKVTYMRLWNLPKLKGFYPGRYITEWPSLQNIYFETNVDGGPNFWEFENRIVWSG
ncbi:hypothetical protein L6164_000317 [Bauhinia variegata]|uniref:Uncharacterized protein n=1 Tax=Bauhinia variegata TaxID=167791 RepID=A0ACB9QBT3_BAUVA|nr:hypothetical protein L6164_000317 [Bauhinia variegata]